MTKIFPPQKQIDFKTLSGFCFAAFTIVVWGVTFICTKSLLQDFSALEIFVARFALAYCMLWILHPRTLRLERRRDELLFFGAGLTGIVFYQLVENIAVSFSTASNVSVIVSICPIFVALIAQIFLHEKHINAFFLIGFAIAFAGVALVTFNGVVNFHVSPKGDLLALASSISWGFYTLFLTKINNLKINGMKINKLAVTRRTFFYALLCTIPLVLFGAFSPSAGDTFLITLDAAVNAARFAKPLNWLNVLFLGGAASSLCFAAWNAACDRLGPIRATVGLYLIPVVTIVFAHFALGEKITAMGACGAGLTILGSVVSNVKRRR